MQPKKQPLRAGRVKRGGAEQRGQARGRSGVGGKGQAAASIAVTWRGGPMQGSSNEAKARGSRQHRTQPCTTVPTTAFGDEETKGVRAQRRHQRHPTYM